MINRQFVLSCFLLFLSVAGWADATAKCAYAESAVRLQVLEINYCLELHSTNKSGSKQYVRYLRRTLRNKSAEPIETEFVSDLTFSLIIGNEGRLVSRMFETPATDTPEAEHWRISYTGIRLAPGESNEQRYRLSDFMTEKPKSDRRYSVSLGSTFSFRFLSEPKSKLIERMSRTKEDGESSSRASVNFYDVYIR